MRCARETKLLFSAAAVASLLAMTATATDLTNLPNLSSAAQAQTSAAAATTNTKAATTKTTNTGSSASTTAVVITGGGSAAATAPSAPVITGAGDGTAGVLPPGLPTLTGAYVVVAPSVPPTANAPYMKLSTLPEGTVFIAVGAILGFLAMSVVLWRGLVAWSLHRSVRRAALHQNISDTKSNFLPPAAPFYKYTDRESTISLSGLGHKGGKRGARPSTAGAASTSSLFFSPTAGAGAGINSAGNRGSNYLPAGYYAAGAAAPGNGQGVAHIGSGNGHPISLANLGAQSQGYSRARSTGPSPPDSPAFGPAANSSTMTLNNQNPAHQRTPSVFLDDLFDGDSSAPISQHRRASRGQGRL